MKARNFIMWINTLYDDWICGDEVCCVESAEYLNEIDKGVSELTVQLTSGKDLCIVRGAKEEVTYVKEQLATAFIEGNRKVFDVQSELWMFRKEKSDDERSENSD